MAYTGATRLGDRRNTVYQGRHVRVEFRLDRAGIRKIAMRKELLDACRDVVVRRAVPYAVTISPHGRRSAADTEPPYAVSWRVAEGTAVLVGMKRVSVKLVNVSPHAAAVEFVNPKTGQGHGYRVLGRTLAYLSGKSIREARSVRASRQARSQPRGANGRFLPRTQATQPAAVAAAAAPASGNEAQASRNAYVRQRMASDPAFREAVEARRRRAKDLRKRKDS